MESSLSDSSNSTHARVPALLPLQPVMAVGSGRRCLHVSVLFRPERCRKHCRTSRVSERHAKDACRRQSCSGWCFAT